MVILPTMRQGLQNTDYSVRQPRHQSLAPDPANPPATDTTGLILSDGGVKSGARSADKPYIWMYDGTTGERIDSSDVLCPGTGSCMIYGTVEHQDEETIDGALVISLPPTTQAVSMQNPYAIQVRVAPTAAESAFIPGLILLGGLVCYLAWRYLRDH